MSRVIVAEDVGAADTEVASASGAGAVELRAAAPAPGAAIGRYTVLERLGRGGMGVVLSAYDPTLDRRVALKLISSTGEGDREEYHERLVQEARAMAKIRHPNVVSVYEVGEHDGQVYLAMEQVEGGTMRARLREREARGARDWRATLADFIAAGRGLIAAHEAGMVHRDFKPENVFADRDGRVLVGDFGLVGSEPAGGSGASDRAPIRERLTRADIVVGTPAYMAPEQHTGEPVDARADQFAFCVALYEALYGELPFAGDTRGDYARAVLRGDIREPPAGRRLPGWLRAAILRGLAADPASRHASMAALLAELGADPASEWTRGRRERTIAIVAGAGFTVVWAAAMLGLDVQLTYPIHYATNAGFLAIIAAIGWLGRRTFTRTSFNRRIMGFALAAGLAVVLLAAGGHALAIPPDTLGTLHLLVIGALLASATATLDARLGGAAAVYLAGFLAAALSPRILLPILLFGHATAGVSTYLVLTRRRRDGGEGRGW